MLEVCVVLAMAGIMLSVAALSLRPTESGVVRARTFGQVLRGARARALRESRAISVAVSSGSGVVEFTVLRNGAAVYDAPPPADSLQVPVLWEVYAAPPR